MIFKGPKTDLPTNRGDAKREDSPHYATGQACLRGHLSMRLTSSGGCMECRRQPPRERNPKQTQVEINAVCKEWRLKNPKKVKEAYQKWHSKNKEVVRERRVERYRTNPSAVRAYVANRRALKASAAVAELLRPEHLARLLQAAKSCPDCQNAFSKKRIRTIDHVIALARGGAHAITNFRIICRPCNSSKGARAFASNGQGLLI